MVNGYKKEPNFIKQIHQTKSLFYWTGKFEGKKITSIRAPFRNMEEIINIKFYLLKFHSTPCMGSILFIEQINIKSIKICSIELD